MAKKTRSSKKTTATRATPAKKAGVKKPASSKSPTSKKKPATKKKPASGTKKATGAKASAKKTSPASRAKAPAKKTPTKKTGAKKPASAKKSSAQGASKPAKKTTRATTKKAAPPPAGEASKPEAAKAEDETADDKKNARKGITIVNKKTTRRAPVKKSVSFPAAAGGGLLGPNAPKRKPLIPSGPSVNATGDLTTDTSGKPRKSPFKKPELKKFRELLVAKAGELIGDVSGLEEGALRGQSGGLSHLPQHMAEFGSETYEQTLSLDLAAADRRLLKEIDDAIGRIEAGTFGICERTGKPIGKARLNELPWARYSIEAARDLERRSDPR
ncbi:MAG: hypothetical protein EA378_05475 [Phycisphaerales bacterium]|nr:MAG: hypothetical protein EA378_05475 [Phycisphaerales bacterium]